MEESMTQKLLLRLNATKLTQFPMDAIMTKHYIGKEMVSFSYMVTAAHCQDIPDLYLEVICGVVVQKSFLSLMKKQDPGSKAYAAMTLIANSSENQRSKFTKEQMAVFVNLFLC